MEFRYTCGLIVILLLLEILLAVGLGLTIEFWYLPNPHTKGIMGLMLGFILAIINIYGLSVCLVVSILQPNG
jgi:hypothetical protein